MKKGFTLTELLIALTIVGVITTLVLPVTITKVHNKAFVAQLKNTVVTIEQVAQNQLITNRTKDLANTDFADSDKLLSDNNFRIIKKCSTSDAATQCWKTGLTGADKVTYKTISKATFTPLFASKNTIILKNGAIISYKDITGWNTVVGQFYIDINGNDKPNIAGRDLFSFYISTKGKVVDINYRYDYSTNHTNSCKTGNSSSTPEFCYSALVMNGWVMDY